MIRAFSGSVTPDVTTDGRRGRQLRATGRGSSVVEQGFCKALVAGSSPAPGSGGGHHGRLNGEDAIPRPLPSELALGSFGKALVKIKADFITERILKGENEFMPDKRDVAQDKKAMEQNEEQGTTAEVVGKHPEHAPQAGKKTPQVDD